MRYGRKSWKPRRRNRDRPLKRGETPSEDLTGWVYVQGLKNTDDSQLAVLWDKKGGLSDTGFRTPKDWHAVGFVDGSVTEVKDWNAFLEEQDALRKRYGIKSK